MLPRWSLLQVDNLKRFAAEMIVIVLGILIALFFDGLVEERKERKLVAEAKAGIAKELAANRAELAKSLGENAENRKKIVATVAIIDRLLKKEPGSWSVNWGANLAELREAAWETARESGALAHMTHAEIARFSETYGRQRDYLRQQERLMDHVFLLLGQFDTLSEIEGKDWSPEVLRSMRAAMVTSLQALSTVQLAGNAILKSYDPR